MTHKLDTFLDGANSTYLLELAKQYADNPNSVPEDWWPLFDEIANDHRAVEKRPTWGQSVSAADEYSKPVKVESAKGGVSRSEVIDSIRAIMLIRAYRVRGHMLANLDPLELESKKYHPELDPKTYGFTADDYNRPIFIDGVLGLESATLNQIIQKLHTVYGGKIGVEFMHIQDPIQKAWVQTRFENDATVLSTDEKTTILKDLTRAEMFEKTIHVKFPGAKRFGLDGGESMIPALETILRQKAKDGMEEVIFGMSHRGRLSVLANILEKPIKVIFGQFDGFSPIPADITASGDVKYHLGYSKDRVISGQNVHLSLTPNPSHLEAVNPVVLGKVRARQDQKGDHERKKVLGILLHGDAAFAGQGIVAESLAMCGLDGYETGGTIHVIVNNQIGFTTSPPLSRSCPYTTDIGKFIQAPVFHVNGDDPEAVIRVAQIASEFHTTFGHDIIIDIVCYRRFGHNESDEPMFTQPLMYKKIKEQTTTRTLYEQRLIATKVIDAATAQSIRDDADYVIKTAFDAVQKAKSGEEAFITTADWMEGRWSSVKGVAQAQDLLKLVKTGVDVTMLRAIGMKATELPAGFNLNNKIQKQLELKREMMNSGAGIDWSTAESLAFASLLLEGSPVRLSGQDCERGTFSQRHAVLVDQETETKHTPINHIQEGQAHFEVINSLLSELAVLGFEYGYTSTSPKALVCWEAQFGDFSNGAQIIIDQFISSAEAKWLRLSGLVMLLPHGFEGQGPEHSSARLERYLQLCAENNMYVMNCSTPANYFHALRRQIHSPYRKPLVIMTPKSLLRHKLAVSDLKDMGKDTHFKAVIDDTNLDPQAAKRIVVCSGKVYYDLLEAREKNHINDIAIVRLEQFHPFPVGELTAVFKRFNKIPVVFCQEEPENMGAWHFIDRRLENVLTSLHGEMMRPIYVGRPEAASPATGLASRHVEEQNKLVNQALMITDHGKN